ncbi:MAG: Cupin 2 conserved barrel domain protein, partial [Candidatus Uhrbacteria bacterium GW2011_GWA2_41_10]
MSYITNIVEVVAKNTNFRTVLYTATKSQLVVMNIPPGENVGEETHAHVEQILFFQSGNGKAILDGQVLIRGEIKRVEKKMEEGFEKVNGRLNNIGLSVARLEMTLQRSKNLL